ncbi:hypothetical protein L0156_08210 [bacterium]|nr:hypothetical protein [bacterium]
MDYYHKLKIAPNASRKEIEQAYQRLLKESRYDTSIDRREIENAYKVLSDLNAKSQYDTRQTIRLQKTVRVQKRFKEFGVIAWIKRRTRRELLVTLGFCLSLMISFYSFRFGYLLKTFQAGDVLYDKTTDKQFGKVLKVEQNYPFGSKYLDAYQVELDPAAKRAVDFQKVVWLPQDIVKARCYKKQ